MRLLWFIVSGKGNLSPDVALCLKYLYQTKQKLSMHKLCEKGSLYVIHRSDHGQCSCNSHNFYIEISALLHMVIHKTAYWSTCFSFYVIWGFIAWTLWHHISCLYLSECSLGDCHPTCNVVDGGDGCSKCDCEGDLHSAYFYHKHITINMENYW